MPLSGTIEQLAKRYAPTALTSPYLAHLSPADQLAVGYLVKAAKHIDEVFLEQKWSGNPQFVKSILANPATPKTVKEYVLLNKGPWSILDDHERFIDDPTIPAHPPAGANYYPEDMTKEEFLAWLDTLTPEARENATGYFHLIRRSAKDGKTLEAVPYSEAYKAKLHHVAVLLRDAAQSTTNASLRRYLTLRAEAFVTNDYFASDVAWMELDSPIEVVIGPYEVYQDRLMNYKAAFEAFICIRNEDATKKLAMFQEMLGELETHLPLAEEHKHPDRIKTTPIRAVDVVMAAGDVAGPFTLAFCLPNDERVIREKGSKLTLMKNAALATFDAFYIHTLCHESCHAIGPHDIEINGRKTTVRAEMMEVGSALEEAKADIVGLWALHYLIDKGMLRRAEYEQSMYVSFVASALRSIRFGLGEAHGKGLALQLGYLIHHGSVYFDEKQQKLGVRFDKIRDQVRDLAGQILSLQAIGNKAGAQALLNQFAVLTDPIKQCLDRLHDIPIDIRPVFEGI